MIRSSEQPFVTQTLVRAFPTKTAATGTPDFITPARCSYDMAIQLGGPCNLVEAWKQPLMDGSWRVFSTSYGGH